MAAESPASRTWRATLRLSLLIANDALMSDVVCADLLAGEESLRTKPS